MTAFMDVHIIGEKEAASKIQLVGARAADARPAFLAIREILLKGHEAQFSSQGGFLGTPWAPLASSTIERKIRMGQSQEVLKATGALETALTGGTGKVASAGKTFARAGVSGKLFWGRFAQAGRKGGRGGDEPARPIVGIGAAEGESAIDLLERFIVGAA